MIYVFAFWPFFDSFFSQRSLTNPAVSEVNLETIISTTTNGWENEEMISRFYEGGAGWSQATTHGALYVIVLQFWSTAKSHNWVREFGHELLRGLFHWWIGLTRWDRQLISIWSGDRRDRCNNLNELPLNKVINPAASLNKSSSTTGGVQASRSLTRESIKIKPIAGNISREIKSGSSLWPRPM